MNDPNANALSNLSPYFHFGNLASQRAELEALKYGKLHKETVELFFEESIIRRELADNYCEYNSNYHSYDGFPDWSKKTLEEHASDKREIIYTLKQLADTYDELRNASQIEMLYSGKMHGDMRMY